MRASRCTPTVLVAIMVGVVTGGVSAHRRDELLQATRIAIEPERVELELDLTPGIAIADAFIADIDRDRDGAFSAVEQREYARKVLAALALGVDDQPLHTEHVASSFAELDAFRRGEGTIRVQAAARLPRLSDGEHQLTFRNAHRREVSVYLANALVPESERIAITAQRRDTEQRDLTIEYLMRGSDGVARPSAAGGLALIVLLTLVTAIYLKGTARPVVSGRMSTRRPRLGAVTRNVSSSLSSSFT
jgi:hypothetical protein